MDGALCEWPMGHRNAKDHRCNCTCDRDQGHKGKHMCRHEREQATMEETL